MELPLSGRPSAGRPGGRVAVGLARVGLAARSYDQRPGPRASGTSSRTSPSSSWWPTPPPPLLPWQLAALPVDLLPSPSGPARAFSVGSQGPGVDEAPRAGSRPSTGMAQNGIFGARLAACDVGGSGLAAAPPAGRRGGRAAGGRRGRRARLDGGRRRTEAAAPCAGLRRCVVPPPSVAARARRALAGALEQVLGISVTTVLSTRADASRARNTRAAPRPSAIFRTGRRPGAGVDAPPSVGVRTPPRSAC